MGFQLQDLSTIEPSTGGGGGELLPIDDYRLQADEISDENVTKDGTGKYVTAKFTVIEGELEGSSFYVNFNIENKNPKAVEIAWRDLSAWGHAVGVLTGDSDALLYKPFLARVGIEKSKDPQYKDKNKILKYYRQNETPAPPPAPAAARPVPAAVVRPAAVAATGARPWAKRA
jgi:hypothetical protein